MQQTLCFDDVLLVPQYSEIETRSKIDLSSGQLTSNHSQLLCPVVGSPMDTVMSPAAAAALSNLGGFGVLHRYCTIQEVKETYLKTVALLDQDLTKVQNIMVAVGAIGDFLERTTELYSVGCRSFCIDVAHGHHMSVKTALQVLRSKFNDIHIMTGNVATLEAFNDLSDWGSDSIRVGVGGGSMCSTRIRTGHGVPTLQSVMDCAKSDRKALIVADGGIRNSGDAVKALAAGADLIMLGSILAGHEESPGDTVIVNGNSYKKFRGMASREAQLQWRGRVSVVEGESTLVPYKGSISDTVQDFLDGIKSGVSYSGSNTIHELRNKAVFVQVTSQGVRENGPHGKL